MNRHNSLEQYATHQAANKLNAVLTDRCAINTSGQTHAYQTPVQRPNFTDPCTVTNATLHWGISSEKAPVTVEQ